MAAPLVVGFDLDLTLVDSRPGIAATYRALAEHTGVFVDADAAIGRLGGSLDEELSLWFPAHQVTAMGDLFRKLYADFAVVSSPALPGAAEAFAAVRQQNGQIIVITGKYGPNAHLHLNHLGLVADAVVGWVWAEGKIEAMTQHGTAVYVGDHPADMAATRATGNGTVAIGVSTGNHTADELFAAGAHVVLNDLTEFPVWLGDGLANSTRGPISVGLSGADR